MDSKLENIFENLKSQLCDKNLQLDDQEAWITFYQGSTDNPKLMKTAGVRLGSREAVVDLITSILVRDKQFLFAVKEAVDIALRSVEKTDSDFIDSVLKSLDSDSTSH